MVARASLPGAARLPGLASFSLEAITTADLPRRLQYSSACPTRRVFSSAPLRCADEPVTSNAPSRVGVTNDSVAHPANARVTRQTAKREDMVHSPSLAGAAAGYMEAPGALGIRRSGLRAIARS